MTRQNRKLTRREKKLAMKRMFLSGSFRAGLIVFIVFFGISYVLQTTAVSTKGYIISDLERTVRDLKHETKQLEVDIAGYTSMQSIQARLSEIDLVVADSVDYITPVGTAVARR